MAGEMANTFTSLYPIFKESYSDSKSLSSMKTHKKPGKEEKFINLKKKLKAK